MPKAPLPLLNVSRALKGSKRLGVAIVEDCQARGRKEIQKRWRSRRSINRLYSSGAAAGCLRQELYVGGAAGGKSSSGPNSTPRYISTSVSEISAAVSLSEASRSLMRSRIQLPSGCRMKCSTKGCSCEMSTYSASEGSLQYGSNFQPRSRRSVDLDSTSKIT